MIDFNFIKIEMLKIYCFSIPFVLAEAIKVFPGIGLSWLLLASGQRLAYLFYSDLFCRIVVGDANNCRLSNRLLFFVLLCIITSMLNVIRHT
jgi:hypothetical protein